jgi:hypothetical protein
MAAVAEQPQQLEEQAQEEQVQVGPFPIEALQVRSARRACPLAPARPPACCSA